MTTRWTPTLFERIREHAAAGHSMRETAIVLGIPLTSLVTRASIHKIKFHGKRGARATAGERAIARHQRAEAPTHTEESVHDGPA